MTIDESNIIEENQEDKALACLLAAGVLFTNTVDINCEWGRKPAEYTTCIYVNCSDVFMWGCADGESICVNDGEEGSEVIELYKLWKEDDKYGEVKWVCYKRNMQPQYPLKKMMIEAGSWNDKLEALPLNPDRKLTPPTQ